MKKLFILLFFTTPLLLAQPSQFSKLLTDNNDYTCVGAIPCATWPMPELPASGGSYIDPIWGTTTWRLAVPAANTSGIVIPSYSRVQAWNSDGTLMFMTDETHAGLDLYDATTTPPTPINAISTDGGSTVFPDAADNDASWAFTDSKRIYFTSGSGTAFGLSLSYVDVSACTPSSCTLHVNIVHTFSCITDGISDPELGNGVAGNKIETGSGGQGGLLDKTDTYFSFMCDKVDGTGRHAIDFVRYNRSTDTVVHQFKWYTRCPGGVPAGCAAYWYVGQKATNVIRMNQHPDHRFITVLWQAGGTNGISGTSSNPTHINITSNNLTVTANNNLQVGTEAKFHNLNTATYLNNVFVIITSASPTQFTATYSHVNDDQVITSGTITGLSCVLEVNWVRGCGTEVFDDDYNFLGAAISYIGHQDTGYDVNGVPVLVGVGSHRNDLPDERALTVTDLTTLSPTAIISKRILLPCSYSRQPTCTGTYLGAKAGASHISMTGSWGVAQGYGLLSTMIMAGPSVGAIPNYPPSTSLGTAVTPGTFTVTPGNMNNIGVGIVSTIDTGSNMESVTWTSRTALTATATFTKSHTNTASVFCLSCGDTGYAAMENVAVKIDTTAADGSDAITWRIGRTMAIRDNCYNCEPHTSVNRDFTQIIWGSSWNTDPPGSTGAIHGFWTKLAAASVASTLTQIDPGTRIHWPTCSAGQAYAPNTNTCFTPTSFPLTGAVINNQDVDKASTNWTTCILPGCNPGGINPPTAFTLTPNTTPSLDNGSMLISETCNAPSCNGLAVYKGPACEDCTNFYSDEWIFLSANCVQIAEFELDVFSFSKSNPAFANGTEFMFGKQWNQTSNVWQIWNQAAGTWVNTSLTTPLSCAAWHHIQTGDHRIKGDLNTCSGSPCMYYDFIILDGVKTQWNLVQPAGALPGTFKSVVGTQFQLNQAAPSGSVTVTVNVNEISLTAFTAN